MRKTAAIFCICIPLCSCTNVEDATWKYGGGYHIGDVLVFREPSGFTLRNDTIYEQGKGAVALVEKMKWRVDNTFELTICALNDTTRGFYYNK